MGGEPASNCTAVSVPISQVTSVGRATDMPHGMIGIGFGGPGSQLSSGVFGLSSQLSNAPTSGIQSGVQPLSADPGMPKSMQMQQVQVNGILNSHSPHSRSQDSPTGARVSSR